LNDIPLDKRIYLDESGINQHLCRRYGRSPRGEKIIGEISGMSFARESFIACLSRGKLLSPMCFQGTCNTGLFNAWLEKMVVPQLQPGQVLILDNASFHRSEESKKLVESAGCRLMFLPPYSPDLNPIEKCWANIKAKVRELVPKFSKFTDALDAAILSM
jgi:transposase